MLTKNSAIPLHVQLAALLRDQMQRRELPINSRLPSERELCDHYGISRITVRQALATLAQEGLVSSAASTADPPLLASPTTSKPPASASSAPTGSTALGFPSATMAGAEAPASNGRDVGA